MTAWSFPSSSYFLHCYQLTYHTSRMVPEPCSQPRTQTIAAIYIFLIWLIIRVRRLAGGSVSQSVVEYEICTYAYTSIYFLTYNPHAGEHGGRATWLFVLATKKQRNEIHPSRLIVVAIM